jgi:uncharacterized protein YegJ (DUF2314 family)
MMTLKTLEIPVGWIRVIALSGLCLVGSSLGCQQKMPETLVQGGYDQKEMDDAIALARSTTQKFIEELQNPKGNSHSVKAPITDNGETEHFWLTDVTYKDGVFNGKIGNEPGMVTNVKIGQDWQINQADISDWMYFRDGKMYGNYTARPLMKAMPEAERKLLESMLAEPL